MKINDGEIRLGNGETIPCDITVDLTKENSHESINAGTSVEDITFDLHEGLEIILKKCLEEKYKKNFDRCRGCEYFQINVNVDTGSSSFCCGLGVSQMDMLTGDICLLVD